MALPMVWLIPFPSAFFFSRRKFDFSDFGCILFGPLKNAPIPQEVKGSADGDSLRQLFSSSDLTSARMRGIVLSAHCLRQIHCASRWFRNVSAGFPRFPA